MRERSVWSRLIAMMLAVAMVLTSQPVNVLAEEGWKFIGGAPNADEPALIATHPYNVSFKDWIRSQTLDYETAEREWLPVEGSVSLPEGTNMRRSFHIVPPEEWFPLKKGDTIYLDAGSGIQADGEKGDVMRGEDKIGHYEIENGRIVIYIDVDNVEFIDFEYHGSLAYIPDGEGGHRADIEGGEANWDINVTPKEESSGTSFSVQKEDIGDEETNHKPYVTEDGKLRVTYRVAIENTSKDGNLTIKEIEDQLNYVEVQKDYRKDPSKEEYYVPKYVTDSSKYPRLDGDTTDRLKEVIQSVEFEDAPTYDDTKHVAHAKFKIVPKNGQEDQLYLAPGEKLWFYYQVDIDNNYYFGANGSLKNAITVKTDNDLFETDDATFDRWRNFLKKSGRVDENGNIEYTIQVNSDVVKNLEGWILEDTLTGKQKLAKGTELTIHCFDKDDTPLPDKDITVSVGSENEKDITWKDGLKGFKWVVPEGMYKWTLTYYAEPDEDGEGENNNTAKLTNDLYPNAKLEVPFGIGFAKYRVEKSAVQLNYDNDTIRWAVVVDTAPTGSTIPAESVFTDKPKNSEWHYPHHMDSECLNLKITDKNGEVEKTKYSWSIESDGTLKIVFKEDLTGPVTVSYSTKSELALKDIKLDKDVKDFKNEVTMKLDGENYETEEEYQPDFHINLQKITDPSSYTTEDWKEIFGLAIDPSENELNPSYIYDPVTMTLAWGIIANAKSKSWPKQEEIVIKDIVPPGTELVPGSIQLYRYSGYYQAWQLQDPKASENWSYTLDADGTIHIMSKGKDDPILILLKTKITDENIIGSGKEYTFKNHAELDVGIRHQTAEADKTIDFKPLTKRGEFTEGSPVIHYTLEVNPSGKLYGSEEDKIILTDTMGKNVGGVDEIKVYKVANGTKTLLESSEYTVRQKEEGDGFILELPNQTHLIVEYTAYAQGSGTNVDVSNSAKIECGAVLSEETEWRDTINVKGSSASGGMTEIKITKLNAEGFSSLSGAEFDIYKATIQQGEDGKYYGETGERINRVENQNYATGEDGKLTFSFGGLGLKYDTWYCIKETKAPDGFINESPECYFMVKNGDSMDRNAVVQAVESKNVVEAEGIQYSVISIGGTLYLTFYNHKGELTVHKTVTGPAAPESGTPAESPSYNVTVTYKGTENLPEGIVVHGAVDNEYKIVGKTITFSIKKDQDVKITNLPIGTYTVTESGAEEGEKKYEISYEAVVGETTTTDGEVTLTDTNGEGRVTITNNYPEEETGGLTLTKEDSSRPNKKLSGAVFAVYMDETCEKPATGADGNPITMTTGWNGSAIVEGLVPGTYYVKETTAPEGYLLDGTVYEVEVKAGDPTPVTPDGVIKNTKPGFLEVHKVDEYYTPLAGAIFTVYSNEQCTDEVGEIGPTDALGYAISDPLVPGSYWVKETTPPNGYEVSNETYSVEVSAGKTSNVAGIYYYIHNRKPRYPSIEIPVKKFLEVNGKKVTSEELFTFELKGYKGQNVYWPTGNRTVYGFSDENCTTDPFVSKQVQVKADGTTVETFGPIYYNVAGHYTYKLTETEVSEGTTADPGYEITVIIERNGWNLQVTSITYRKLDKNGDPIGEVFTLDTSANPEGALEFTNKRTYRASGSVPAGGQKQVNGAAATADQAARLKDKVEFLLDKKVDGKWVNQQGVGLGDDGTFNFEALGYTQEDIDKTYEYRIREAQKSGVTDMGGFTVDGTEYTFTVEVKDGPEHNGELALTVKDAAENVQSGVNIAVTFNNTYTATGSTEVDTTKELTGRALSAGEFTFELWAADASWNKAGENALQTVPNGKVEDGKEDPNAVDFKALEYTLDDLGGEKTKTFYYVIVEQAKTGNGIGYDDKPVQVKVTVTDDGDGNLEVTPEVIGDHKNFINTYTADGTFTPNGTKSLTGSRGEGVKAGEFTFIVEEIKTAEDGTQTRETKATGTTEAGGKIDFGAITYTLADVGTHTYEVSEVIPAEGDEGYDPAITYSTQSFTVTVTVSDSGTGELTVTPAYDDGAIAFVNDYTAKGSVPAGGAKQVNGAAATADQAAKLKDKVEFLLDKKVDGEWVNQQGVGLNDDGTFNFETLEYTQEDIGNTYEYRIREAQKSGVTDMGGFTVDGTEYTFTVEVKDGPEHNGELALTVKDAAGNVQSGVNIAVTFNNTYTATGSAEVDTTKTLTGRALGAGEFTFELRESDGSWKTDGTVLQTVPNGKVEDGKEDPNAVDFKALGYTLDDLGGEKTKTFYYVIVEQAKTGNGIGYDAEPVQVKVTVTDDGDGSLEVTPEVIGDHKNFINTYTADGTFEPNGTKSLMGSRGEGVKAGEFTFTVEEVKTAEDGTESRTQVATGTTEAGGKIDFGAITYTLADVGTHTYEVSEVIPAEGDEGYDPAITYSTQSYTVTVTVSDSGTGELTVTPVYDDGAIAFVNTYTATGSVPAGGQKQVNGTAATADQAARLKDKVEFLLDKKVDGKWVNQQGVGLNDDGTFNFEALGYTQEDIGNTYEYRIREAQKSGVTDMGGFTVSTEEYTFTVEVKDGPEHNGELALTVKDAAGNVQSGVNIAVTFNNTYTATGSTEVDTTKTLTGRALGAGEFTFELWAADESWNKTGTAALQTVTNGKVEDGKEDPNAVDFEALGYTLADLGGEKTKTFYYVIVEQAKDDDPGDDVTKAAGITYDTEPVKVKVTVTDDGDGSLEVTPEVIGEHESFSNTYEADGRFRLNGNKTLTGSRGEGVKADEFSFVVTEDGNPVATGKTLEGGAIDFTEIEYTLKDVGTHTYMVSEVIPAEGEEGYDPAITYDPHSIEVKVLVLDRGNGTLVVSPSYAAGGMDFVNTYSASGSVPAGGEKLVNGEEPTEEQLAVLQGKVEFQLWRTKTDGEADEENLSVAALGEGGKFDFKAADGTNLLSYTQDDIGKTYTYEIREVLKAGAEAGTYTLDDAKEFTVEVQDGPAHNGQLALTVTVDGEPQAEALVSVTVDNTYTATGSADVDTTKALTGRALSAGEFTFELWAADEDGIVTGETALQTVTNGTDEGETADPNAVKFTMDYDLEDVGTHHYVIREQAPAEDAGGIAYDRELVHVTVTVADNGDGTLDAQTTLDGGHTAFVNTYTADGTFKMNGSKTLTGGRAAAIGADEFSFLVEEVTTAEDGTESRTQAATGTTLAGGMIDFTEIAYALEDVGTHTYVVSEVVPAEADRDPSITYSTQTFTVTVTVADNGDGSLTVTPVYPAGGIDFINMYSASGSVPAGGEKLVNGEAPTAEQLAVLQGKVEFQLWQTAVDGAEEVKNLGAAALGADGKFGFRAADGMDLLSYTQDDIGKTYTYEVREVLKAGAEAGTYTLDSAKEFTVEVQDGPAHNGQLALTMAADGEPQAEARVSVTVDNTYTASGSAEISTAKTLTGRTLSAGEFTFELWAADANGSVTGTAALQTVKNGAGADTGAVRFAPVEYTLEDVGTHHYVIREQAPAEDAGGIAYDREPVQVTVEVTDNGDGTLGTAVTLDGEHTAFINTYTADGTFKMNGSKTLTGSRAAAVAADEFRFLVEEVTTAADGTETRTQAATGTTLAGGMIDFTEIAYTLEDVGTHTYVVSETVPAEADRNPSITYSTQTFTVTVTVADGGQGNLTVTPAYPEGGVAFVNDYTANGTFTINNVQKTLTGAALAAGQFSFQLRDAAGTVLQTKTNAADGSVAFDPIAYTQADIGKDFVYTVAEVNAGAAGITYDAAAYTVTVHVADAGNGALNVTAQTTRDGRPAATAAFANAFAGSVTLTKTSTNGNLLPGAAFQLYARGADGWYIYNATYADGTYTTGIDGTLTVAGLPANDYYFIETQAPAGHVITTNADGTPVQYPFTIAPEGSGIAGAQVNAALAVTNQPQPVDTTLVVTKQLTYLEDLWTAVDDTFYVALYADEALTQRVSEIRPIRFQNQSASSTEFTGLEPGRTYYVGEVNAEGVVLNSVCGVTPDEAMFMPVFTNGNTAAIMAGAGTQSVFFRNAFQTLPQEYYREGQLTITKQLLGADGTAKAGNGTFYAGIFADEAYTTLAEGVSSNIVALNLNGRDTASDTVSVTIAPDTTVTLYVTETDAEGHPVEGAASFAYDVTVEGAVVSMTQEDNERTVVITNQEREEIETETELQTEENQEDEILSQGSETHESGDEALEGPAVRAGTGSVKTGDETPLGLYIGLMAAAAALLLALFLMRRRKRSE